MRHGSIRIQETAGMKPDDTTGKNAAPDKGNKADRNNASR